MMLISIIYDVFWQDCNALWTNVWWFRIKVAAITRGKEIEQDNGGEN